MYICIYTRVIWLYCDMVITDYEDFYGNAIKLVKINELLRMCYHENNCTYVYMYVDVQ